MGRAGWGETEWKRARFHSSFLTSLYPACTTGATSTSAPGPHSFQEYYSNYRSHPVDPTCFRPGQKATVVVEVDGTRYRHTNPRGYCQWRLRMCNMHQ